jgi:hypothetical protein
MSIGPRRPRIQLIELLLVVLFCGMVAALIRLFARPARIGFATILLLEIAFFAWFIPWKSIRARRTAPECRDCGRRFVPTKKIVGPPVCPRCQRRSLSPAQWSRERAKGIRTLWISILVIALVVSVALGQSIGGRLDRNPWLAIPVILAGTMIGFVAVVVFPIVVVQLVRARLMQGESYAVAHAYKVAGEKGHEEVRGPVKIWSFGAREFSDSLTETMEEVRQRFEARIGEPIEVRSPLRIFVFAKRDALVDFHRQSITDLWNLDGFYSSNGPTRSITLSTEVIPYRLVDPRRMARILCGFYFLDSYKGFLPSPWLRQGIGGSLAGGGDGLARLNRKILAALDRGDTFDADFFRLKSRGLMRLLGGWSDQRNFARVAQLNAQSWSFVEYLWGGDAPPGNRDRFRAFLRSFERREPVEAALEHHFGRTPDWLLDDWKNWVRRRGAGVHRPPTTDVRDALVTRLIPIVEDRGAKIMDRIQAIRDMGSMGYPVGADALIELLEDCGEIPKSEIVWSLEAISGIARGDDIDRWRGWWSSLPPHVQEGNQRDSSDGSPSTIPSPSIEAT